MKKYNCSFLIIALLLISSGLTYSQGKVVRTIYVSQATGTDENNGGTDINNPVKTIYYAERIARNAVVDTIKILFKGGEVFDQFTSHSNSAMTSYDKDRNQFAFVWDTNRHLILSTYGSDEKAIWYSGKYTHEGGPQTAIVINKTSASVKIENIHFLRWQICAVMTYDAKNVSILNNRIEEIGTLYFPDEKTKMSDGSLLYAAGAIYPKNSSNILIKGNYLKNLHNSFNNLSELHAFYMTRLDNSEICNNIIINASGSPLKVRRSGANNIYIHDNEFYYVSPSEQIYSSQPGFFRYSGDAGEGCPYAITIENNKFHYPYVWFGKENSSTAVALKYSISNTTVCGTDACEDTNNVKWINNDFKFKWEPGQLPTSVSDESSEIVSSFKLFQNYPNPFNPSTKISYRISEAGPVTLKVFDLLGRDIATIVSEFKSAGLYQADFDASHLSAGIYFYQLVTRGLIQTKKMLLLK